VRRWSAFIAGLVCAGAAAGALASPALQVVERDPLSVRGLGFHPGEHVRVTATLPGQGRFVRTATAGAQGAFTVRYRSVAAASCGTYRIVALGDRGSRATRIMPLPPCGAQP
jgi:hypothetical protein